MDQNARYVVFVRMADSPHSLADSADSTSQEGVSFSEEQRESFRALAASMSFVGVCSILFGVLLGLLAAGALYSGFTTNGLTVLAVVVLGVSVGYIPAGWWAMAGGRSLSALVSTRGRDVAHLMASVKQLRALFGFARAVIIVQALVIAAVAGVLVWCTLVVDKGTKCVVPWG